MTSTDDIPESTQDATRTASLGEESPLDRGPFEEGALVNETYLVRRRLGEGGNGLVLEAERVTLGDLVALKVLRSSGPEGARRLAREARCLASLKSRNVARVYDVGAVRGAPYVVLERLEGESLASILARRGKVSVEEAVRWAIEAARGLSEAHASGIVHRDIKPSNLFLAREGGVNVIKVIDFGVATAASVMHEDEGVETQTGALLGSPLYMAPEQIREAREVDARADVWSLGVTLYELMAGVPPFHGTSHAAVLAAVIGDTPQPLRERVPEVPPALESIVRLCLSKDREARPASMHALAEALAQVRTGPPARGAVRRWASALLAIGAVGFVASWAARRPPARPTATSPPLVTASAEAPLSMPSSTPPSVVTAQATTTRPKVPAVHASGPPRASGSPSTPNVSAAISERK